MTDITWHKDNLTLESGSEQLIRGCLVRSIRLNAGSYQWLAGFQLRRCSVVEASIREVIANHDLSSETNLHMISNTYYWLLITTSL